MTNHNHEPIHSRTLQAMTEQEKNRFDKIKSYCSFSVLIFAGCISLLTYSTTKAKIEAKVKHNSTEQQMVIQP